MPCYDERSTYAYGKKEGEDERKRLEERCDVNARVACEALHLLEEAIGEVATANRLTLGALTWWEMHKKFDKKRK
jgi:hypothetical protein